MLIPSLVLSAFLLLAANAAARGDAWGKAGLVFLAICSLCFLSLPVVFFIFPGPFSQFFLLAGLLWYVKTHPNRRRWFFGVSVGVSLLAYGVPLWFAVQEEQRLSELRRQYPFVSLAERLPERKHEAVASKLTAAVEKRVEKFESALPIPSYFNDRTLLLEMLHERQVELFASAPGFGYVRMPRPSEESLNRLVRPDGRIPQPVARWLSDGPAPLGKANWEKQKASDEMYSNHLMSVVDFVNNDGFGYFKERRKVSGFQSHRFSRLPWAERNWTVETVDLVGLLLHDEPVAYVSANLPNMDELRGAPTRTLDVFEGDGLETLRNGEDLVVERTPTRMRMLGSIRAATQCVQCHGCERGDLLGAFSYWLRNDVPESEKKRRGG